MYYTDARINAIIRVALDEDVGWGGEDVTTNATIPVASTVSARFLAKATGVLAGQRVADLVFAMVDKNVECQWSKRDGQRITKGEYFGTVRGAARSLLVGERIALNLMQRMSGVATATAAMVAKCRERKSSTQILDTRKTVPGLRVIDKMAVAIGGGTNHRFGLHDMVMIKDNHITAAGGITPAVQQVQAFLKQRGLTGKVKIELETRTLEEVELACTLPGIDRVMLDNMVKIEGDGTVNTSMLQQALKIVKGRVDTEASGNVTMETVGDIAATHVDYISSGALTHSVMALDISLKIQEISKL